MSQVEIKSLEGHALADVAARKLISDREYIDKIVDQGLVRIETTYYSEYLSSTTLFGSAYTKKLEQGKVYILQIKANTTRTISVLALYQTSSSSTGIVTNLESKIQIKAGETYRRAIIPGDGEQIYARYVAIGYKQSFDSIILYSVKTAADEDTMADHIENLAPLKLKDAVGLGNLKSSIIDILDVGSRWAANSNGYLIPYTASNYTGFIIKVKKNTDYAFTYGRYLYRLDQDKKTIIGNLIEKVRTINSENAAYLAISFPETTYPLSNYVICEGTSIEGKSEEKVKLPWLDISDSLKTINGESILGSGDLTIEGGGGGGVEQDPDDPNGGIVMESTLAEIDKSLTLNNYAADAKATGDKFAALQSDNATLTNTTETPVVAGKVWTSTESGAEWANPTGGTGDVTKSYVDAQDALKQDKLIAGYGISIANDGKTISSTGGGSGDSSALGAPTVYPITSTKTARSENGYYYAVGQTNAGTWHADSGYKTTEYIEIGNETEVCVYSWLNATKVSIVQFFDADKNVISVDGKDSSTGYKLYTFSIPENAKYYSWTSMTNAFGGGYSYASKGFDTAFAQIADLKDLLANATIIEPVFTEQGGFYRDGTISTSSSYGITDYIPCSVGDNFIVDTYGVGATFYTKAYYDADKNVLCYDKFGDGSGSVTKTEEFTVPHYNAKYVRFTAHSRKISIKKISTTKVETPDVIKRNEYAIDCAKALGVRRRVFESASATDAFVMMHFSDIHGDGVNLRNIMYVKDHLSSVLDDTLCTGDIVRIDQTDTMDFWDDYSDGSILTCIGNHDVLHYGDGNYMTNQPSESELYNKFMSPYIENWGTVEHSDTNLYYYKDYPTKGVRLIVINSLYATDADITRQDAWLATALSGAKTNGYAVVIGQHYYPATNVSGIASNWTALVNCPQGFDTTKYGAALPAHQATVQTFIDGGGNFACWLCGHKHADYIVYNTDYPKQMFIGVGGALFVDRANEQNDTSDMRRLRDTKSEDCMNVMSVDPYEKIIKLVRIGVDRDLYQRHRGTITLNYATSPATVVYQD